MEMVTRDILLSKYSDIRSTWATYHTHLIKCGTAESRGTQMKQGILLHPSMLDPAVCAVGCRM